MKKIITLVILLAIFLTACDKTEKWVEMPPGSTPAAKADTTTPPIDRGNDGEAAASGSTAETMPELSADELETVIARFIQFNHAIETLTVSPIVTPNVNTLYAIYQTYLWETELGTEYGSHEEKGGVLIPVADVQNAMAWIYNIVDRESSEIHEDYFVHKDNTDYLWLPDGFSLNNMMIAIQTDTLTLENDMYKFDVIFYDDVPGTPELFTFTYYFKPGMYKDLIPCATFVKAERVR